MFCRVRSFCWLVSKFPEVATVIATACSIFISCERVWNLFLATFTNPFLMRFYAMETANIKKSERYKKRCWKEVGWKIRRENEKLGDCLRLFFGASFAATINNGKQQNNRRWEWNAGQQWEVRLCCPPSTVRLLACLAHFASLCQVASPDFPRRRPTFAFCLLHFTVLEFAQKSSSLSVAQWGCSASPRLHAGRLPSLPPATAYCFAFWQVYATQSLFLAFVIVNTMTSLLSCVSSDCVRRFTIVALLPFVVTCFLLLLLNTVFSVTYISPFIRKSLRKFAQLYVTFT